MGSKKGVKESSDIIGKILDLLSIDGSGRRNIVKPAFICYL